jgi:sarcosine dehydrogenase
MVGLHLPLVPMKHAYVVTENIPEVQGLPNIRDHDASIYFRVQEQSLCMGGYETNPILLEKVCSIYMKGSVGLGVKVKLKLFL